VRSRARHALVAVALLLPFTACGARWDDAQRADVAARGHGGAATAATSATGSGGPTVSGGQGGATATTVAAPGAGPVGSVPTGVASGADPAAPGGNQATAAGPLPCSAPSDAPGVTDTDITLGSISTLSGAVPGLGASSLAAAGAYVAYRNSTGGVCGRQLVLKTADDNMDNSRHRSLVAELGPQVLGLVGGVGGGDAGSADEVEAQQLPVVATPISESFQDASTVFDINPPFADVNAVIGKYRYLYDQGVRTVALVYIAVDQTRSEIQGKQKPQMIAAGLQIVNEQELPLSTLSFDSAARAVANSGADYLLFLSESGQSASMARSMHDTGYDLMFEEYVTAYGSNFVELAGDAAEGTTSWIRNVPNEEPGTNAEQTAFLTWMAQTAPDEVADTFAADSWAAAKGMVDALTALPGPISRDALLQQLRATTNYDAGGFIGPIQLGPKRNNGCFIAMIVASGVWRRLTPAQGFLC
jgi:ABC-type branched-subunit amino acid transport system substrate-binding protein